MVDAAKELIGGYAVVAMTPDRLVGMRDPLGIRPLVLGRLEGGHMLASETAAITSIGAEPVREVEPGELVIIDRNGVRSRRLFDRDRRAFCVFEYIYLARQDSEIEGHNVHLIRKEIGRVLARERPLDVDVVIPTPDSSVSSAMGYAEEAGIPYEMGLVKNRYVGRTFIQPTQATRQFGVRLKLHPIRTVVKAKRVVLLDDSIVRGTTTANVIRMLREAGAKEVHMVVASPPFTHPCHYGIDVPTPAELIASRRTIEEVRRHIDADSLHYLSLEGLQKAVEGNGRLCHACFSGTIPPRYPAEATPAGLTCCDADTVDSLARRHRDMIKLYRDRPGPADPTGAAKVELPAVARGNGSMAQGWHGLMPRVVGAFVAITLGVLLIASFLLHDVTRTFLIEQVEIHLQRESRLLLEVLADHTLTAPNDPLSRTVTALTEAGDLRITVIAASGEVLVDSEAPAEMMENHAGRPEVAAALQGRPGRSVRFSSTVGTGMLYLAFPVETPDGRVVVRTALPTAAVDESLQRIRAIMFRLAVASLAAAALFVVPLLTPRRAPAQGNDLVCPPHRPGPV